jgi:hypothetical protein
VEDRVRPIIAAVALSAAVAACDNGPGAPSFRPVFAPQSPPAANPSSIGGTYMMTLSAAATCATLPDYAKTRVYEAAISQAEGSAAATIRLRAGEFTTQFPADVIAATVFFGIDSAPASDCSSWFEALKPAGWLYVCGEGELRLDGATMSGTLDGIIGYEALAGDTSTANECRATHSITFVRK